MASIDGIKDVKHGDKLTVMKDKGIIILSRQSRFKELQCGRFRKPSKDLVSWCGGQ
jgi:hypothetical protein